jgi:flagellar motor switch protein FliM
MSEVFSQNDMQSLLSGVSDAEAAAQEEQSGKEARRVDLTAQERIVRGRMPGIDLVYDRFARSVRPALSSMLGQSCMLNVSAVSVTKFGAWAKTLKLPSSIHIFRMPPLQGQAMLTISSQLGFSIVDCLFGGKGGKPGKIEGREFTAIENRLIAKVVLLALDHLKEAWSAVSEIDFVYVRSEQNPLAVNIISASDMAVIVDIALELDHSTGSLNFCLPYLLLEPLKETLASGFHGGGLHADEETKRRITRNVMDAEVELSVCLAKGKLKSRDLLKLKVGDIIPLATPADAKAIISIQGKPKFEGVVGDHRGSRAVKITGIVGKKSKT